MELPPWVLPLLIYLRSNLHAPAMAARSVAAAKRESGRTEVVEEGKAAGRKRKTFVFVNNRLEGNAVMTIEAMISAPG